MSHQSKTQSKNGNVLAYPASPEPLFPPKPPFLARHPWVGFLIFIVFGAIYAYMTQQVLTHGPLTRNDASQIMAIHLWARQQPQWLILLMRGLSAYGRDGEALMALILTIGWVRRKARRELYMLFFGMLAGELWFQALGNIVNRHRPVFSDPFETLTGAGFPSGHSVTTVLLAWMMLYLLLPHIQSAAKRFWVTAAILIVSIAILVSRLFLGLHYPTDVYAGVVLGLAWGGFIYTVIDLRMFRRQNVPDFHPAALALPVTGNGQAQETVHSGTKQKAK